MSDLPLNTDYPILGAIDFADNRELSTTVMVTTDTDDYYPKSWDEFVSLLKGGFNYVYLNFEHKQRSLNFVQETEIIDMALEIDGRSPIFKTTYPSDNACKALQELMALAL